MFRIVLNSIIAVLILFFSFFQAPSVLPAHSIVTQETITLVSLSENTFTREFHGKARNADWYNLNRLLTLFARLTRHAEYRQSIEGNLGGFSGCVLLLPAAIATGSGNQRFVIKISFAMPCSAASLYFNFFCIPLPEYPKSPVRVLIPSIRSVSQNAYLIKYGDRQPASMS